MAERRRTTIELPDPPSRFATEPQSYVWDVGRPIVRCHWTINGPREFLAGERGRARFSAFRPARAHADVPVLYGATDRDGALSETVLRNVPVTGAKSIARSAFNERSLSFIAPTRELRLADLHSIGLRRIGLLRQQLIETDERFYPTTALWARALHAAPQHFDGLVWVSRQNDASEATMLFGDRVDPQNDLRFVPDRSSVQLHFGEGRRIVDEICDRADITVVEP